MVRPEWQGVLDHVRTTLDAAESALNEGQTGRASILLNAALADLETLVWMATVHHPSAGRPRDARQD